MDLTTQKDLERMIEVYRQHELSEKPRDVGMGFWRPTPLQLLPWEAKALSILLHSVKKKENGGAH